MHFNVYIYIYMHAYIHIHIHIQYTITNAYLLGGFNVFPSRPSNRMMIRIEVCNLQYFSDGLKPPTSGRFVALIYLRMEWMDADEVPVFQEDAWMMVPIVG